MNAARRPIRTLLVLTFAAAAAASAQTPTQTPNQTTDPATPPAPDPAIPPTVIHHARPKPPVALTTNTSLIVIDPAHGASDNGATFADTIFEKDVTLALANRLATALQANGFTVLLTRTNSTDDVAADARIDLANRSRPLACILLHAASGGHGVHLYNSALTPPAVADPNLISPWDTAQIAALPQSLRLTTDLANALGGMRVPLVTGRASVQPIDSLTCPAVAVEIAPLSANGGINTPVTDPNYQARVAQAISTALVFWRGHAESTSAAQAAAASTVLPAATPAARPRPALKPKPKPAVPANPDGTPAAAPAPIQHKPAPIVRAPPSTVPPASAGVPPTR